MMSVKIRLRQMLAVLLTLGLLATACGSSDTTAAGETDTPAPTAEVSDSGDGADDPATATTAETPTEVAEQLTSSGEGDQDDNTTEEMDPVYGGEITYGIASDGTGFNTTDAINEGAYRITSALNDSLVIVDFEGNWVPHLAENLVSNDDFTEWTITLRPDVRFHDGEPVDAEAVKANMDAFRAGSNVGFAVAPVTEVNVTGPLEVQVLMNTPWAAYPYTLFGQAGYMVSPETIGQNDTFVGVGAFKLESWNPGDTARVVRNDDYWRGDEGYPYLDAITFKVIPEQTARRAALEAGDVEAINSPGEADIIDFLEDDSVDVYIGEAAANEGLIILNTTTAPTDDLRIRRAMAHAIDRDLIIETFRGGLTTPAASFVEPNSPWYVETDWPAYDPEEAKSLVAEYEAEVGPAEMTILGRNAVSTLEVADLIKAFFDEVGIDTTIEPIAPGTEVLPVITDAFQAIMWAQFSSQDPDGQFVFFHSSGGPLNWSNLVSPKIDEGFEIGRSSPDPEVRFEGYAMVQEALAEEVPMLWFDHWGGIEAVAAIPAVHGIPEITLRSGERGSGLVAGSYFSWEDIWVEP